MSLFVPQGEKTNIVFLRRVKGGPGSGHGNVSLQDVDYYETKQLGSFFDLKESDMKEIIVLVNDEQSTDDKAVNYSALQDEVRQAFYKQFPRPTDVPINNDVDFVYPGEVWDEFVIGESMGDNYRIPYTRQGDQIAFVSRPSWQPVSKVWVNEMKKQRALQSLEDWEKEYIADIKEVTKSEGDGKHPASHYLVVEDPESPTTWHLRFKNVDGDVDRRLLGAAWAALHKGYRGNKYQGPGKQEAISKLKRLYKQEEMPLPSSEDDKQAGACECEKCGHREDRKGKSCGACPECETKMSSVTGSEMTTAAGDAGRAVIAGTVSGIESQTKDNIASRLLQGFGDLKDAVLELVGVKESDIQSTQTLDLSNLGIPIEPSIALKALDDAAEFGSSLISFKGHDGRDWLLTFTTNAFEDREGEIFATQSIADYVTRHEKSMPNGDYDLSPKGEYQFWHLPGTKFGDIRWQAPVGRFLLEAGTYDDNEVGRAFKSFFERFPNGHPDLAPDGWGCSHKYEYKSHDREDSVYDWFEKSETTVLPLDAAANPYTSPLFIHKERTMNEKQLRALELIGGKSLVSMVQEVGEKATAELEGQVAFKSNGEDYLAQLKQLADGIEDGEAKKGILDIAEKMKKMPPWLKKPADEDEEDEDEDEEEEEKKPKKKKQAEEVPAEASPTSDPEPEPEPESEPKSEPESEPESAPADEPAEVTADEKAYRDAVAESFTSMVEHFNGQIGALGAEIKQLKETIGQVARDDEEKIAEKAMLTPAASLLSTVQRAIGVKETRVDGRTEYAKDTPQMASSDGGITPIPMLNMFMTNEDQKQAK